MMDVKCGSKQYLQGDVVVYQHLNTSQITRVNFFAEQKFDRPVN